MEVFTKTVERKYVNIGGKEVRLANLIDFLTELEGATQFNSLRYTPEYSNVAEACINEGFVDKNIKGSWILNDNEKREELLEEAYEEWDD